MELDFVVIGVGLLNYLIFEDTNVLSTKGNTAWMIAAKPHKTNFKPTFIAKSMCLK